MSTPRHRTAPGSSYFVTTKCWQGRCVFQMPETAQILVETLLHYRDEKAYFLHEFVLMPDHLHLLITPSASASLEKAVQLIKGGSSRCIHKQGNQAIEIWQKGFYDWTIRDANDWNARVQYIRMNPVRAKLVDQTGDWPYSSAGDRFAMDPTPRRYSSVPSGAEAPSMQAIMAGLKPRPPEGLSSSAQTPTAQTGTLASRANSSKANPSDGGSRG
ncbi:MAG: REP-associated tyrosine transposase [Candidatus Acidiferrales bacterium]